jgi:hypothetical protein
LAAEMPITAIAWLDKVFVGTGHVSIN